jgi:threonine/homoserine/homoserine lactone efflux protein
MSWIIAAVALAFAGLVVLGFLGVRVLRATAELGREVNRTRSRLEPAQTLLRQKTGTIPGPKG